VKLEKSRECLVETGHSPSEARNVFRMRMIFLIWNETGIRMLKPWCV
jgi:hypothetical protein